MTYRALTLPITGTAAVLSIFPSAPEPWRDGDLIGRVTMAIGPVVLHKVGVIRLPSGAHRFEMPKVGKTRASISDDTLAALLLDQAVLALNYPAASAGKRRLA